MSRPPSLVSDPHSGVAGGCAPSMGWLSEGGTVPTSFSYAVEEEKVVRTARPPGWRGETYNDKRGRRNELSKLLEGAIGRGLSSAQMLQDNKGELGAHKATASGSRLDDKKAATEDKVTIGDKKRAAADEGQTGNEVLAPRAKRPGDGQSGDETAALRMKRPGEVGPGDETARPRAKRPDDASHSEEVAALRAKVKQLEAMLNNTKSELVTARNDAAISHGIVQELTKRQDKQERRFEDQERTLWRLRDERNDAEGRERRAVEDGRAKLEEVRSTMGAQLTEAREIARALHATLQRQQMPVAGMPMAMVPPQAGLQYVAMVPAAQPAQLQAAPAGWGQSGALQTYTTR
jgi:hypothetical protein